MPADAMLHDAAGTALGWLATYALHSTILLGLVWLVSTRRWLSDGTLDILWKIALVGGLLTATAQSAVERAPLAGQLRLFEPALPSRGQRVEIMVRRTIERTGGAASAVRATALPIPRSPIGNRMFVRRIVVKPWPLAIVAAWMVGAFATLVVLVRTHRRLMVRLAARRHVDDAPTTRSLDTLLRRAGIARPVRLTTSDGIASPVAMRGDEICLPSRALVELDAGQRESILAHEIAHLERRDPAWLLVARVMETVFFFQPLNRLARRRMQEVAEYLCDDWAVERTGHPLLLAKCLASVAEWLRPEPQAGLLSAMIESGGSPLARRVRRILHPAARSRPASRARALALGTLCVVVLAAAAPRVSVNRGLRDATAFLMIRQLSDSLLAERRGEDVPDLEQQRLGESAHVLIARHVRTDRASADSLHSLIVVQKIER